MVARLGRRRRFAQCGVVAVSAILILPPDQMSDADIKLLREAGICAVVAKDPNSLRFVSGDEREKEIALRMIKWYVSRDNGAWSADSIGKWFARQVLDNE